ncbi:putative phage repressor [Neorhizobium sp. NCHU2750]|nr:putative phage repressor [Neorhizobium sp. NCHU2750]
MAYPTYAAHENGQRKFDRHAERYARFFKVSIDWLLAGRGPGPGETEAKSTSAPPVAKEPSATLDKLEPSNAKVGEKLVGYGQTIPVYGQAVGGIDGEFIMNGNILFEVLAPPVLSHVSGAYGAQVSGESMSPRYEDGEICFVDPTRRVRKGDYVIAQIQTEEHGQPWAYVKKFVRHNAVELVLEQFNPPKELRFPADSVVSVHFIALAGAA